MSRLQTPLTELIYTEHPRFAGTRKIHGWHNEHVEGGDVLLLSPGVVAVSPPLTDVVGSASLVPFTVAAVVTPVQIGVGDWAARFLADRQPVRRQCPIRPRKTSGEARAPAAARP